MKLLAGVLGVSTILAGFVFQGAPVEDFFKASGLVMILGATIFFTLAHHSTAEILEAARAALRGQPLSVSKTRRHIATLSTPRIIALASGGLGFVLYLVHLLTNLDDPKKVGGGIASAVIVALYGLIISEFIIAPMINRISTLESSKEEELRVDEGPPKETPWTIRAVYSFLGLLSVLGAQTYFSGSIAPLLGGSPAIIVLGATILFSFAFHSPAEFKSALKALNNKTQLMSSEASRHIAVLATPRIIAIAAGSLGFLVGFSIVCQNLDDPSRLGPGMATAILSPLYAIFIAEILMGPWGNRLSALTIIESSDPNNAPVKPSLSLFLTATVGNLLTLFLVLSILPSVS